MLVALNMVLFIVSATIGYLVTDHTNTPKLQGKTQIQVAQLGESPVFQRNRSSQIETVWELSADRIAPNNEIARCGIGE